MSTKKFSAELQYDVNSELSSLLGFLKENRIECVLATAAPGTYASYFSKEMGFDDAIFSTNVVGNKRYWMETIREVKRDEIAKHLSRSENGTHGVIITDHLDDMPSIRLLGNVLWVGDLADLDHIKENECVNIFTIDQIKNLLKEKEPPFD